jgi:hypothetical protein
MTFLRRLLCLGFTASLLALVIRPQTRPDVIASPAEKATREWLHSGEPRLVAWGAHDALVSRNPYLVPDLLAVASEWQLLSSQRPCDWACPELSPELKEQRLAMASVLDALIQMNVAVPVDSLRSLAPDFGNAVAVLLARLPGDESAALRLEFYRSRPGQAYGLQYVCAAVLAMHPNAEFAEDLLGNTMVEARIFVMLPDSEGIGIGSAGSWASSAEEPRENWPKIGQYKLSKEKTDGAFVVVGGIDPIYASREEASRYLGDGPRMAIDVVLGPEERRRLIAELLGAKPEEIPWKTSAETTIRYETMEQFKIDLLAFVAEQEQKYRQTAEALEARDLLAGSEVLQSLPQLELKLVDVRGKDAEPFPKEMGLPDRVKWSMWPN